MFTFKPDYEQTKARIEAFWEGEIIDRPVAQFIVPKPVEEWIPEPISGHATSADRWLDADYQAELALARCHNIEFMADALPIAWPNLGPEIFSAFYGCEIHFGDYGTSWTDPVLLDWADMDKIRFNPDSPYLAKLHEMTDALIAVGQGKFIVGMTDWHPGGDWLAALRDPQNLATDLIEHPDEVKQMLAVGERDYMALYDVFYAKLRAAGNPITSWLPLLSDGKYYIPSNDFSCMVSQRMYREFFLPGIRRECQFLDRSIYHLDGPGALRHLDDILAIPELGAVQWVCGAGNEGFSRWVEVYRRILAAGKGAQVNIEFYELDEVLEALTPKGVYLTIGSVPSREAGLDIIQKLERWAAGKLFPAAKVEAH
ncbi:MAG: hypothetical protein ABFD20_04750 [Anaerolineales bacterium]